MRMTVTNGNARNKIPFRARHGLTVCTIVPSVRAAKHRPALINLARAGHACSRADAAPFH